jgi:hypothetical protein
MFEEKYNSKHAELVEKINQIGIMVGLVAAGSLLTYTTLLLITM